MGLSSEFKLAVVTKLTNPRFRELHQRLESYHPDDITFIGATLKAGKEQCPDGLTQDQIFSKWRAGEQLSKVEKEHLDLQRLHAIFAGLYDFFLLEQTRISEETIPMAIPDDPPTARVGIGRKRR